MSNQARLITFHPKNSELDMSATTSVERVRLIDPREAYAKPPFKDQSEIEMPGKTTEMSPKPDHGEKVIAEVANCGDSTR